MFDAGLASGTGEVDGASRLRFVAVVVRESSGAGTLFVPVRGLPLRPDDRCCGSESTSGVVGKGVLGCSGLIFGGRPGFLLGGSMSSEVFDATECDGLSRRTGVVLMSAGSGFADSTSCLSAEPSGSCLTDFRGGDSWSESGLISRSSLEGLRGRNPIGTDLRFHGVELALCTLAVRLWGRVGTGVVFAETGYW